MFKVRLLLEVWNEKRSQSARHGDSLQQVMLFAAVRRRAHHSGMIKFAVPAITVILFNLQFLSVGLIRGVNRQ